MKRIALFTLAASGLALTSCETTGDPYSGGMFGWSPQKFDQRIQQKDSHLRGIRADTADQQRTADGLSTEAAARRRQLRRLQ